VYTELQQWLPVSTPQGNGFACAVIDYSQEAHLLWVCIMDETGEIWCVTNGDVRVRPNPSMKAMRGLGCTQAEAAATLKEAIDAKAEA
jgi:hypothetical protein